MLRDQLLQSSSLNAALLKNHGNQVSYLFTSQEARLQDLDSIFSLAHNGFQLLATLSKQLANFKTPLLSPAAKLTDRTHLSKEENEDLDRTIEALLFAISPFLMEQGASKIIEWLVRRFRVHEFNVDALLTVFLPFHCTPQFIKLISLLHIPDSSVWSFLRVYQKALTPLPFEKLIQAMKSNTFLSKHIFDLMGKYIEERSEHRAAIGFYLKVNLRYLSETKLDDQIIGNILSSTLVSISTVESVDAALSTQVKLHLDALNSILISITRLKAPVETSSLLVSISLILRHQEGIKEFPVALVQYLEAKPDIIDRISEPEDWTFHASFLRPWVSMLCTWPKRDIGVNLLIHLLRSKRFNRDACVVVLETMLQSYHLTSADDRECFMPVFRHISGTYPEVLHQVIETLRGSYPTLISQEVDRLMTQRFQRRGSPDSIETSLEAGFLLVAHTEPSSRVRGIRLVLEAYKTADGEIKSPLSRRLHDMILLMMEDTDVEVLRALHLGIVDLKNHVTSEEMVIKLESVLQSQVTDISAEILSAHASILEEIVTDQDKRTGRIGKLLFPFLIFTKSQCRRTISLWKVIQQSKMSDDALLKGCDQLFPQLDWKTLKGNADILASYNESLISTMTCIPSRSSTRLLALILLHGLLDAVNGKRKFELGIRLIRLLANETTGILSFNQRSLIDE
ncbi:17359_t:CDS:2, partial [Acaulospora colombiana]